MNVILLSGGSGKRLWPLSNEIRSKQFLKLFKNPDGEYESMLQKTYRCVNEMFDNPTIVIAAPKMQVSELVNQLGKNINISIEPDRKDTFPAIVLATCYLHYVLKVPNDEPVIVCPVDSFVEQDFYLKLSRLYEQVQKGKSNIYLLGIEPKYPSDKYGYIIPETKDEISKISSFKEKPSVEKASDYIKDGGLWNCGVSAFKIGYLLKKAHSLLDFRGAYDLYNKYSQLEKISFDYAVLEHEPKMEVMKYSGVWEDLGTWNSLAKIIVDETIGDVDTCGECSGLKVINMLNMPILCSDLNDMIIIASPDGILISTPTENPAIKEYVDKKHVRARFIEKSWGTFEIIDSSSDSLSIKLFLRANQKMSYHSHAKRDEIWNIISGSGVVILDGKRKKVKKGQTVSIKKGVKHTISTSTEMEILEIQLGEELTEADKQKYDL